MGKEILLTIAVPTYNGAKTIKNMLDVLLPQCDDRVEVVICNNASTDETGSIIADYKKQYPFVQHIRNDRNIGPDSNFILCMKMARGKYTLLLSDDDILVENSLSKILDFLEKNEDMGLVYLNAVGFHEKYNGIENCEKFQKAVYDDKMFVTRNRKIFMDYAGRMWGFLSCFICLTEAFKSIDCAERFKKTNWLQSYIHILCAEYGNCRLGVISTPYIAAGIYSIISNFDSGRVDGIAYRDMLDFAIEHGFDKQQLNVLFLWRICFIFRRTLIKERAAGVRKSRIINVIKCTWMYPSIWIKLYPFFLLPPIICRAIVAVNNKRKGYNNRSEVNRQGDIVG